MGKRADTRVGKATKEAEGEEVGKRAGKAADFLNARRIECWGHHLLEIGTAHCQLSHASF